MAVSSIEHQDHMIDGDGIHSSNEKVRALQKMLLIVDAHSKSIDVHIVTHKLPKQTGSNNETRFASEEFKITEHHFERISILDSMT